MARSFGSDLRRRVVDAIEEGLSTRKAVKQFSIGISTAGSWHRHWRDTGSYDARKQGKPQGAILDEHGSFLMGLIEERADITLSEMVDRLESERSLRVDPSTIWYFLDRNDITAVSPLFGPPGVRFSGFLSQ